MCHPLDSLVRPLVYTSNESVIALERLERQLLFGLDTHFPHLLNFRGEHDFGLCGRIDTVGLDGNEDTATDLEEQAGVETYDTSLVWTMSVSLGGSHLIIRTRLSNIGEDAIDHGEQHAILERMTGVFNNGDDVRAAGCHINQITARAVRELNSVDAAFRADDIGNMRDGGSGSGAQVKDLASGLHVDVVYTTQDTGCQLASEGIPYTVLD
jgi:hypothetical protein